MEKITCRRLIISMFFSLVIPAIFSVNPLAAEEYVFDRMWPVLEQPWCFRSPNGVTIDGVGNVYVAGT